MENVTFVQLINGVTLRGHFFNYLINVIFCCVDGGVGKI